MAQPVNLNRYRKAKARAEDKPRADQNAAAFGRTKAERDLARAQEAKAARDLDGKKREE
jgi:hypothetical protein